MPVDTHELQEDHADFYGHLLKANRAIDDAGTSLVAPMLALAIGSCVAIHMEWFDRLFDIELEVVRGWGSYIGICVGAFAVFATAVDVLEKRAYSAARDEIAMSLQDTGWTANELITAVSNDDKLEKLAEHLERDKHL